MRARLKFLHSPDVSDLATWVPDDEIEFGFLLQAMIARAMGKALSCFDILVCSPRWLERDMASTGIRSCEHLLLMTRYDHRLLLRYLEQ